MKVKRRFRLADMLYCNRSVNFNYVGVKILPSPLASGVSVATALRYITASSMVWCT